MKILPSFNNFLLIFLLLAASISLNRNVCAEWIISVSPVNVNLRSCVMVTPSKGWATGDDGVIIHTSDGGTTFTQQFNPVNYYINDVCFVNERLGWIVANETFPGGSTIISTTNGGLNWTAEKFKDSTRLFRTIYFLDSLTGFLAGFGGAISKTTDCGKSWFSANVDTSTFSGFPINKISFADQNTGFAVGGYIDVAGIIWRTTDGGLNWSAGDYSPEPFYDLLTTSNSNIIAAGGDFEYGVQISITTDKGVTWTYNNLEIFGQAYSISSRTDNELWMALGYGENWAVTYNAGANWSTIPVQENVRLLAVDFADSLHGIAVGAEGVVYRYVHHSTSVFQESAISEPVSFHLKAYPNPFNPSTTLSFVVNSASVINLEIFSPAGRLMLKPVNEKRFDAGQHTIPINASDFPSGAYFARITSTHINSGAKSTESVRIILMK